MWVEIAIGEKVNKKKVNKIGNDELGDKGGINLEIWKHLFLPLENKKINKTI